jgi:hypothetical protein
MLHRSSPIVEVIALQQTLERVRMLIWTVPEATCLYEGVWKDLYDRQHALIDTMGEEDLTQVELLAGMQTELTEEI